MQQLLLVGNPARRKTSKRRNPSRRAASPAQKRARAAFARMARARAGKKRTRRASSSLSLRSNPVKRRHARRANPVHHRRARRNPVSRESMTAITGMLKSAAVQAAGALGVDVAFGFVQSYLPTSIQTPTDATTGGINYGYYATKGAAAVGIGMLLKKMMGSARAARVVEGSLTVTIHDAMKQFMTANVPSVTLGMYPQPSSRLGMYTGPTGLRGMNPGKVIQMARPAALSGPRPTSNLGMYANTSRERAGYSR